MPRMKNQIMVRRPIDEVFSYTADLNRLPDRHPDVVCAAQTSLGPVGAGTTFDVVFAFGRREVALVYTITEFEAPYRMVVRGEGATQRALDEFNLAEVAEGTAVTITVQLVFKGPMKWIGFLLGPMSRRSARRAAAGLAKALEAAA